MFAQNEDEHRDDDDTEDTDLEDENSEDDEDEDDSDDEDDDDSDEDDESDEDDDKPVTRKELRALQKSILNKQNAKRRVTSKKGDIKNKPPKDNDRIERIEQSLKKTEILERKRSFGYENGLAPDEVDIVFKLTKRPSKKFLELPYVKGALDAHRRSKDVRQNTPGTQGRTYQANGKAWKDMDASEKQSNFADKRRAALDRIKGR